MRNGNDFAAVKIEKEQYNVHYTSKSDRTQTPIS